MQSRLFRQIVKSSTKARPKSIHDAITTGDIECVKAYLECLTDQKKFIFMKDTGFHLLYFSPLHCAALAGHLALVEHMLNYFPQEKRTELLQLKDGVVQRTLSEYMTDLRNEQKVAEDNVCRV